ncbi:MAG: response regulator transcription factor [Candidatus Eremiobacterota bacterium]
MGKTTRVLLVDDHRMVREGIRAVLAGEPDIEVVAEAASGEEALEKVAAVQPDVVVLDLQMPGMGGLAALRRLKESCPSMAVVVLTVDETELVLVEAIRAGAAGYILKDASSELLVQSIRLNNQGGALIPAEILRKALRGVSVRPPREAQNLDELTPRELEVLRLLARGLDNQDIAERLNLSRVTAKKHVHHILSKLQVSDRTQAALMAVRMGLVEWD